MTPAEACPGVTRGSFCVCHRHGAPEGRSRPAEPQDAGRCAPAPRGEDVGRAPRALPRVGFCQTAADPPEGLRRSQHPGVFSYPPKSAGMLEGKPRGPPKRQLAAGRFILNGCGV